MSSRRGRCCERRTPAEIQALIDAHIEAFNTQNPELFLSVFGNTAVVIDGIAPYRWLNPNVPANWLADVEKWPSRPRYPCVHVRETRWRPGVALVSLVV